MTIKEVIVVEGRYDKNVLSQIVDATILTTDGFGVFSNPALRRLLVRLAQTRGVIVLTDSDSAGFVIRNHLKGILPPSAVKHAYIPPRAGRERRKQTAGKEGLLGVEGLDKDTLVTALRNAGATIIEEPPRCDDAASPVTKAELYAWGLCGGTGSAHRRAQLLAAMDLPPHLTTGAWLKMINILYTRHQFLQFFFSHTERMDVMTPTIQTILERRSVRAYQAKPIEPNLLTAIVEAGIAAPSARNRQPWRVTVIRDAALLDEISAQATDILRQLGASARAAEPDFQLFYHASAVVLVTAVQDASWRDIDCGALTQNMALAARSLGLGSVFIGLLKPWYEAPVSAPLREKMGLGEEQAFCIALALGYPDGDFPPAVPKNKDVIHYVG